MIREIYENASMVERWDDDTSTYTRFEGGEEVESRPYTTAEQGQADAREEGAAEAAEKRARQEAREAMLDANLVLSQASHTPGVAWQQPIGPATAYPLDATVEHAGKTWISLLQFNVWEPGVSGWREVVAEGYPEWVQPTGAHDAYAVGDRVTYLGQDWENTSPANVYAPGVFGWTLI